MNKIGRGDIDKSDRSVGIYCSVRNDKGGDYLMHDKAKGYNDSGDPDPFNEAYHGKYICKE
jgi:hypothetical protein